MTVDLLATTVTITADAVAWYAAVVGTAGVTIAGYVAMRDRAKLRVVARLDAEVVGEWIVEPGSVSNLPRGKRYIAIEVANLGRRTVHLKGPSLTLKGSKDRLMLPGEWLPKASVGEGESARMLWDPEKLTPQHLKSIDGVVVHDAADRRWKGKIKRAKGHG